MLYNCIFYSIIPASDSKQSWWMTITEEPKENKCSKRENYRRAENENQGYERPREATGIRDRPRETTEDHGRPREGRPRMTTEDHRGRAQILVP